jgi:thiamine kinase-like enzyme
VPNGAGPDLALDGLLDRVPCLAGAAPREVSALPGGLTNRNYRVRTPAVDVVVRVSAPGAEALGVNRRREHANSVAAASTGVGAPVVDYLPELGVLVVGFIPSRTFVEADVAANLASIATSLRRLHSGPAFQGRFDMFALQRGYAATVTSRGYRMPAGYLELAPAAARVEAVFGLAAEPLVPCHNDLLAANFLDDGDTIRVIDYEYSGMNESAFELGNLSQENHLSAEALGQLVAAYDGCAPGEANPTRLARAELWGIVAGYGWTLWGAIQHATSELPVDFWAWAMAKWEPTEAAFASPRFERLLQTVADGAPRGHP